MVRSRKPKKLPAKIPPEVKAHVVELSLQNPAFGARRLVTLLEQEQIRISASSVYTILKRNGIQTRDKRFARIQAQHTVQESASPEIEISSRQALEIPPQPTAAIPTSAEQAQQVPEIIQAKAPPPRVMPISRAPKKIKTRSPRFLTLLNIGLLLLLVFLGFHTWQHIRTAMLEPEAVAAITPQGAGGTIEPEVTVLSLNDYRMIAERDLFNVSKEKPSVPEMGIEIEKIAPAEKVLGLRLVGTVVSEDPKLSRAFIEHRRQRKQEAYREGDKANEVLIKKILRNKVIITTEKGDKLLTVEIERPTKRSRISSYGRQLPSNPLASSQIPGNPFPRTRSTSISLDREEVAAFLADTDQLLQDVNIYPYVQSGQPVGFRISRIPPQSVLRKIGLRSRDVITGVNDQEITSPEQAAEFFQMLAEGGQNTIKIKRRRRNRQIKLSIE
jgi:general secretion pathway protein C